MNDQQKRGQKILIGLILGGVVFTALGIAFHPANRQGVGPRGWLFLILVLAVMAGLYQGRFAPKFFTLILLFGGIIVGVQSIMQGLPTALLAGVIVAIVFFAAFIVALLFSKEVAAFMDFRQGKSGPAAKE